MSEIYCVDVRLFDTFEETSTIRVKRVVARNEDEARDIICKMMDKELEEVGNPCAGYEILKGRNIGEIND